MNKWTQFSWATLAALATLTCAANQAEACTGIRLQAKDGTFVYARTMEFAYDLKSFAIAVPRRFALVGTTSSGNPGLAWESKYGVVGMNAYGKAVIIDGVNEKGLAGGIFYLPGYAKFQAVTQAEESRSLASWELITYILTNFATVDEVRKGLGEIWVGNVVYNEQGIVPPVHYIVHDASGNSLVIEYTDGTLKLYDNPIGVITNAPEFDWHLKNLDNYVNLTAVNAAPQTVDGLKIQQIGQGSGLLGLPGDFTPPSRFVRAFALGQSALPGESGRQAVSQAFHVLDSFDIPLGVVRNSHDDRAPFERTQWTTASDMKNRIFYFHSHDNRRVRSFDLAKTNLDGPEIETYPVEGDQDIQDLTPPLGNE